MGKLPVSYVLTGNLLTSKLLATNITGNLHYNHNSKSLLVILFIKLA